MSRFYFRDGEEYCYTLEAQKDRASYDGLKEVELYEAKRDTGSDMFFCKEVGLAGEVRESCGRICPMYKPNNGNNGRCKHYGYVYYQTENKITIKIH